LFSITKAIKNESVKVCRTQGKLNFTNSPYHLTFNKSALSKFKKTKIPKTTLNHATTKGERLALVISYPNYKIFGASKF
jgi:hypothetical protein